MQVQKWRVYLVQQDAIYVGDKVEGLEDGFCWVLEVKVGFVEETNVIISGYQGLQYFGAVSIV